MTIFLRLDETNSTLMIFAVWIRGRILNGVRTNPYGKTAFLRMSAVSRHIRMLSVYEQLKRTENVHTSFKI